MRISFLLITFFIVSLVSGQEPYFSPPVKVPLLLSGSFAELRSDHYHSGIDIKTNGVTGIPVYAAASGTVERIVVSPTGYGRALYIRHDNGTTTVYGHLQRFREDIEAYVLNDQYRNQQFKTDILFIIPEFSVQKGEYIGTSGNTGSSGGPHLHFEVRDTKTQEPLNPLKFGFDVKDSRAPVIYNLQITPLQENAHVDSVQEKKRFPVVLENGKYRIKGNIPVSASGKVGFSVQTNDFFDGSPNRCGIYSMEMRVNDEVCFFYRLDRFFFDQSRYINSHIDYENYILLKQRYRKTWIEPGNQFRAYVYEKERGIVNVPEYGNHKVEIELKDFHGNSSVLEFEVTGTPLMKKSTEPEFAAKFHWNHANRFPAENMSLTLPEGALYNDIFFNYQCDTSENLFYSAVHRIHKNTVPLHKRASLHIECPNLPDSLEEKALVVGIDEETNEVSSAGGRFSNGWVKTTIGSFGTYAVSVDTVPPKIRALSIEGNQLKEQNRIRFKVADELSGIQVIWGTIDGKWALFDYDAKNDLIVHTFDPSRFEMNRNHQLVLSVSDKKNNLSTYEAEFWK